MAKARKEGPDAIELLRQDHRKSKIFSNNSRN